jgi:hypothetical protein
LNTKVTCDNCGRRGWEAEEHSLICPICIKVFLDAIARAEQAEEELHKIHLKDFREMGK